MLLNQIICRSVILVLSVISFLLIYQQIGQYYWLSDAYLQHHHWRSKYCGGHSILLGDVFDCGEQCTIRNGLIYHKNHMNGQIVKRQFTLHGVHRLWIADAHHQVVEYCIRF